MSESVRERLTDPDRRVRLAAVAELSARDDKEAAELLDRAIDDSNRMVRLRALEALSGMRHPRALRLLLARMDDERRPTMQRRFVFDAVVRMGTPAAADALEARLDSYAPGRARRVVAKKIAKMRRAASGP